MLRKVEGCSVAEPSFSLPLTAGGESLGIKMLLLITTAAGMQVNACGIISSRGVVGVLQ